MKISAAIITLNEEQNIGSALASLNWVDEIVVLDSGSSDKTVQIAEGFGTRVLHQEWLGFGKQKQVATEHCSNDWVLSIDADEAVTPELKSDIESLKEMPANDLADGYKIPRKSIYMNREILHSGWYPDFQLRLFRKSRGHWKDNVLHESVEMSSASKTSHLRGEISHHSVRSVGEHIKMISSRYAPLGAEQMARDGKKSSVGKTVAAAPLTFFRTYFLKLGILDGFPGFCIAMFAAYNSFLKYLLLYEMQNAQELKEKD